MATAVPAPTTHQEGDVEGFDDFEVFSRRSTPIVKTPQVTIQRRGLLSFNEAAFEAMGQPVALHLLYSKARNTIGLKKVEVGTPNAYTVRKQPQARSWLVAGAAFTTYYGIPNEPARRYTAEASGDDMLLVDLNQEATEINSPRKKGDAELAGSR